MIAEGRGDADDPEHPGGTDALRLDELVGAELADALDEWARVCAALRRSGGGAGRAVVSRRAGSSRAAWRRSSTNPCGTAIR
ncbi:hypothetical protein SZMC14600_23020 [Saccharomonospora azurea SZMC 14600]|nr:hypothetical protein SZMC14600_23020 [Saccharomonospora azurea SZMC 14600]